MVKKKVCKWLDSNLWGGLHIINDQVQVCCPRCAKLLDNIIISELSGKEILEKRKQFYEKLNTNLSICEGCALLIEKEESTIDIGPINTLILHPYTTCNLHCSYCTIPQKKLKRKLLPNENHILNVIQKFHADNLLKKDFSIALGGGEPSLIEDLKEIAQFLNNVEGNTNLALITNSSISNRIDYVISSLSNTPNVQKIINTSLDSGTRETYKLIKNRDLFEETCNNLRKYAKSGIFNTIILKYVMMNDNSNIKKDDLNVFINFVKEINNITTANIQIIIDADMRIQKKSENYYDEAEKFVYQRINKQQLKAASYLCFNLNGIAEICFSGGRINPERSLEGKLDVESIIKLVQRQIFLSKIIRIIKFVKIWRLRNAF